MSIFFNNKDLRTGMKVVYESGLEQLYFAEVYSTYDSEYTNEPSSIVMRNGTNFSGYCKYKEDYELTNIIAVYVPNHPYAIQSFFNVSGMNEYDKWDDYWQIDAKEFEIYKLNKRLESNMMEKTRIETEIDNLKYEQIK